MKTMRFLKFFFSLQIFCCLVFADTIYLKNGDKIEKAVLTEITPTEIKYKIDGRTVVYTISKNDVQKLVYNDGSEDVFEEQTQNNSQGSTVTVIVRNDKKNYHDTNTVSSLRYFWLGAGLHSISNLNMLNYSASVGYSGLGANTFINLNLIRRTRQFKEETLRSDDFIIREFGLGFVQKGIIALSMNIRQSLWEFNEFDMLWGFNTRFSLHSLEMGIGMDFLYKQWLFSIGPSYYLNETSLALALNASYFLKELNKSEMPVVDIIKRKGTTGQKPQETAKRKRYFRPGIELNYPIWRSEIVFFDNSFPYQAAGAGLFFRIGPEPFYFTTGIYAKKDALTKEGVVSKDFGILGINIASLPLLDMEWIRTFIEVPLLLNFGSGQIRFTGGALLEFYADSEININVNKDVPLFGGENVISAKDAEEIEGRFNEMPAGAGNIYWALGLDIDIIRYWGIGVKFLIWHDFIGVPETLSRSMVIEPSHFQTRVSTYFIF